MQRSTTFLVCAAGALLATVGTASPAEAFPVLLSTSFVTLTGLVVPFFKLGHGTAHTDGQRRTLWVLVAITALLATQVFLTGVTRGWETQKRLPHQAAVQSDLRPTTPQAATAALVGRAWTGLDVLDIPQGPVAQGQGVGTTETGRVTRALDQGPVVLRLEKPDTQRLLPAAIQEHPNAIFTYNPRGYPVADTQPMPQAPAGTVNLLAHHTAQRDVYVVHHSEAELFDGTFHFVPAGMHPANINSYLITPTDVWLEQTLPTERKPEALILGTRDALHQDAVAAIAAVYGAANTTTVDVSDDTDVNRDHWNHRGFFSDHILSATAVTAALQEGHATLVCMDAACSAHVPPQARVDLHGPHWIWDPQAGLQPTPGFDALPTPPGHTLIFVADGYTKAVAVQSWYALRAPQGTRFAFTMHPQSLFINKSHEDGVWVDKDNIPIVVTEVVRWGYVLTNALGTTDPTRSMITLVVLSVLFAAAIRVGWKSTLAMGVLHFTMLSWMHEMFVFDKDMFVRHPHDQDLSLLVGAAYIFGLAWVSKRWILYGIGAGLYTIVLHVSPIGTIVAVSMLATAATFDSIALVGTWAARWRLAHGGLPPALCPDALIGPKARTSARWATDPGLILDDTKDLGRHVARRLARRGPQILRSNHRTAHEEDGAGLHISVPIRHTDELNAALEHARNGAQGVGSTERQWWLQDLSTAATTGAAWSMAPHAPCHRWVAYGPPGAVTDGTGGDTCQPARWPTPAHTPMEQAVCAALLRIERRLNHPVCIEFGWTGERLDVFQVRPQPTAGVFHPATFPGLLRTTEAPVLDVGRRSVFEESLIEGLTNGLVVFDGGQARALPPPRHLQRAKLDRLTEALDALQDAAPHLPPNALLAQGGNLLAGYLWLKTTPMHTTHRRRVAQRVAEDLDAWCARRNVACPADLVWDDPGSLPTRHAAMVGATDGTGMGAMLHHAISTCVWAVLRGAMAAQAVLPNLHKRLDGQHLPAWPRHLSDHPGWTVVDGDFSLPPITADQISDWGAVRTDRCFTGTRFPIEHLAHLPKFGAVDLTEGSPLSHLAHEARRHGVPLRIQPRAPHA